MFKSLIGFEPKFGASALAAVCLLSMLVMAHGYAAEKPGENQENLKREDIKRAESKSGEREKTNLKAETKRDEREKPNLKLETKRGEQDNPKLKMETKGAGSATSLPKPAAAHWDVSPQNKR